jgi:lysyl-tRNA synthetase class 2
MASIEELRTERLKKREYLEQINKNPFPSRTHSALTIDTARSSFESLQETDSLLWLHGRITSLRTHGKMTFLDIHDGTGSIQIFLKENVLGTELYHQALSSFDRGDFIEVEGKLFMTQRGEMTLEAHQWNMLTKSLRPLPEKWHGIQDEEERLRKRYLDIFLDPEKKNLFIKKSQFWNSMRKFLINKGFLEVETPTLEVTTGGAEANPFKTFHKDFDLDVYLRISVGELWHKRLMAAGFNKTFEIGRVYRNEGSSPEHLQEFTNMEFYWAYADYEQGMELVQEMYKTVAMETFGTLSFETRGFSFNLSDEWKRIEYVDEVKEKTGIDVLTATEDEMKRALDELNVSYTGTNRERLTDTLWKYCRKQIAGPAFLVGHPKLVSPLSKARAGNPLLTERFQPILAGSELGNGFSELNDPIDQEMRFKIQEALIERGDEEAMMPDWEFVEMLEHGMPPTCGFGCGERLFSFLAGLPIRETQLFPLLKPKLKE